MKRLRHNLLRERITTALGALLFLASLASVFVVPGITWSDAWVPMAVSLVLMLMPDKALGIVHRVVEKRTDDAAGLLPLLLVGLLLGGCVTERPPTAAAWPDSLLASRPAYLTPPPAGSTPAQLRKWQRAQRTGMIAASRTVPTKLKVVKGSVALATAPGSSAGITAPTTVKASGSATVATAPHSTATNNANVGRKAAGGVNLGPGGAATGAVMPPPVPWYAQLLRGTGAVLAVAGTGLLLYAYGWPALLWLLAWLRRRSSTSN